MSETRLRPMDHGRLLQLLRGEMPKWFVKVFKREVDAVPYGEEYAKGAQRMWDAIVEGYSQEDYESGPISKPIESWQTCRGCGEELSPDSPGVTPWKIDGTEIHDFRCSTCKST
jgi:hypothetical protein